MVDKTNWGSRATTMTCHARHMLKKPSHRCQTHDERQLHRELFQPADGCIATLWGGVHVSIPVKMYNNIIYGIIIADGHFLIKCWSHLRKLFDTVRRFLCNLVFL